PRPEIEREPVPVAPAEQAIERAAPRQEAPRPDARERAGRAGLLAFADELQSLRDHSALESIASGSTDYTGAVGEAPRVERALVTSRTGGRSGGINTAALSRDTGGAGLQGRETTRVATGLAAPGGGESRAGSPSGDSA